MTALEFQSSLESNGTFKVPPEVASQLKSVDSFRVLILVPDDEDADWRRLGMEQFFKGYADSDAIYDDL